jgi:hypothetical protein
MFETTRFNIVKGASVLAGVLWQGPQQNVQNPCLCLFSRQIIPSGSIRRMQAFPESATMTCLSGVMHKAPGMLNNAPDAGPSLYPAFPHVPAHTISSPAQEKRIDFRSI